MPVAEVLEDEPVRPYVGAQSGTLGQCPAAAASCQAQRGAWLVLTRHQPWRPVAEGDHYKSGKHPLPKVSGCTRRCSEYHWCLFDQRLLNAETLI